MFIVSYIVGPFGVERRGEEGRGGDVLELFATLIQALSSKKLKIKVKQYFFQGAASQHLSKFKQRELPPNCVKY